MLELALNPGNDLALQRVINVPPRGIGDATLERLDTLQQSHHRSLFSLLGLPAFTASLSGDVQANLTTFRTAILRCGEHADQGGPLFPRVKALLDDLNYADRLIQMYKPRADAMARRDNVMEFLNSIGDYDRQKHFQGTLGDFVQQIALQDANDRREKDKNVAENAVTLMTIHAAKGLEFPEVYLCGMEQGLFPHQMAMDEGSLEEERRLCYVAITRARRKLFLTYADKRHVMNQVTVKRLSMFINELPQELLLFKKPADYKEQAGTQEMSRGFMDELLKKYT
jgi:superfamily I DNA/RNA helicase